MKDRLKKFYPYKASAKKMRLISDYYAKRPPVHPNYWVLKEFNIMMKHVQSRKSVFMARTRSRIIKKSQITSKPASRPSSPKKNDERMFTSTFYKNLDDASQMKRKEAYLY